MEKLDHAAEIQQNLIECFISAKFTIGDAITTMAFVIARMIVNSNCDPNVVKELVTKRVPIAIMQGIESLCLNHMTEGQRPN